MLDKEYAKTLLTTTLGNLIDMASESELEVIGTTLELLLRKAVFARGADKAAPDLEHRQRFYQSFITEYEAKVLENQKKLEDEYAQLRQAEGMLC